MNYMQEPLLDLIDKDNYPSRGLPRLLQTDAFVLANGIFKDSKMTQMALQAFAAVVGGKCPFCQSKNNKKDKSTLTITNDSKILGDNTPGPSNKGIFHPDPSKQPVDVEIKKDYWGDSRGHVLAQNAHHIIPGNASFAKAKKLHKWLAWEVKIEKKWYSEKIKAKVGLLTRKSTKLDDGTKVVESRFIEKRTEKGARIRDVKNTQGHKVYGKVEYDINSSANGIWLPSNNAINNWGALTEDYHRKYAKLAMIACNAQFHDAHPTYSNSVLRELKAIEVKLEGLAKDCQEHDDSETDPYPAPIKVKFVLERLSRTIARTKLKGRKGKKFEGKWATSRFAANFKMPK